MVDIVEWLRNAASEHNMYRCDEAADEIERLRALAGELANLMMPFALLMSAEEQKKVLKAVRGD